MDYIKDDDAMLDYSCMEKLNPKNIHENCEAFACVVFENGKINTFHRRTMNKCIKTDMYKSEYFKCELASFCGLMVHRNLVNRIGYPLSEYFIWFDDSEYCMRFKGITPIIVQTGAFLVHKVKQASGGKDNKLNWKEFYDVRNQIDMYKRHLHIIKLVRKVTTSAIKGVLARDIKKRKMYFRAIYDGLIGRLGKNEDYCPDNL